MANYPSNVIHNELITLLFRLGVITAEERADALKGTLIYHCGDAGFYDIGTGDSFE